MPYLFLIAILAILAYIAYRFWARAVKRKALLGSNLSARQTAIIAQQVPLLTKLPADLVPKLEGKIQLFLDQVDYHGCDGLEVTDDMRLAIAAQASLLVVNTDQWYTTLRTILIYPGAFKSRQQRYDGYVVTEGDSVRLGESWTRGPVILSWPHSEQGARNDEDGHNVVLHEFAHQLDTLSGHADGAPLMNKGQSFDEWSRVFLAAYDAHLEAVEKGHKTVLDAYGATAHEEFFAVAVEVFFEKPEQLKREEPEVYAQLSEFFSLDPASW